MFLSRLIAVCGKGGVGKSTFLVLVLKTLISRGIEDILVIDGDPDSNLPDLLGIEPKATIGHVMDRLVENIGFARVSPIVDKDRLIDAEFFKITSETDLFDLLVMGSMQSDGCYCPLTHNLSRIMRKNIEQYTCTLLDLPAGLEHINRGVIKGVDILFAIMDGSRLSLTTLERIMKLVKALKHHPKVFVAIANRVDKDISNLLQNAVEDLGIAYGGWLPIDETIMETNQSSNSLLDLSNNSLALIATNSIVERFILQ